MNVLAFDTTAKAVTAALCKDEKLLSAYFSDLPGVHTTETLLPAINRILGDAGMTIDDIDLIAVSAGPGSFTGVRIGAATAKGLAFGRELPCAPVSSLAGLAQNLADREGYIIAAMDARREQLYYAIFSASEGKMTRLTDDAADSAAEAAKRAISLGITDIICVGDGAEIAHSAMTEAGITAKYPSAPLLRQHAYGVAVCGLRMYNEGKTVTAEELMPISLRGFGDPPQKKD